MFVRVAGCPFGFAILYFTSKLEIDYLRLHSMLTSPVTDNLTRVCNSIAVIFELDSQIIASTLSPSEMVGRPLFSSSPPPSRLDQDIPIPEHMPSGPRT
jgi:hypothetical protein